MRLASYRSGPDRDRPSFGAVLGGDPHVMLDFAAARRSAAEDGAPWVAGLLGLTTDALSFARGGEAALQEASRLLRWASQADPAQLRPAVHHMHDVVWLPPIPAPGKVICVGLNYRDHQEEAGLPIPDFPSGFAKLPDRLIGHGEAVSARGTTQLDYEGEVALVIGRECRDVSPDEALDYVLGYTIHLDLSARDIQFREMSKGALLLGKNLDRYGPMGPLLVTRDEVPDPHQLQIVTRVNGDVRQSSDTSFLIFGIPQLVAYWSQMTLRPGDVISTGTPGGVGAFRPDPHQWLLKPGDVVEVEVAGLGVLRTEIVS